MPTAPDRGRPVGNWTVPNLLTVLRIVLTPVFVVFFLGRDYVSALGVFFVCGVTDALDGLLARLLNQRTRLGAMLDPLADKALLVTAYVCLAETAWLPAWLAVTVVSRDAIILGGLALLAVSGRDMRGSIRPSAISKCTTALQMLTVLAAFAGHAAGWSWAAGPALAGMTWLTGAATVLSGIDYVIKGVGLFPAGGEGHDDKRAGR